MSLKLRQTLPGRPGRNSHLTIASVHTNDAAFFAYPSSTNVVLLAPEGDLGATLPFWDALPYRASASASTSRDVQGVCACNNMVIAWSGIHIVLWQNINTKSTSSWRVYATLVASAPISSLDYRMTMLVIGTGAGLELWRHDPCADVVVWDRLWMSSTELPPLACLSPSEMHIAWYLEGGTTVFIQPLNQKGKPSGASQEIKQPREVEWIGWRSSSNGDAQLYVISTNTVLRIYSSVLDDPTWFQLLYSLDHRAFTRQDNSPSKGKSVQPDFGTLWVPDADILKRGVKEIFLKSRAKSIEGTRAEKALEAIEAEESDIAVWFGSDGTVSLRSIANLDRKPPTLIRSDPLACIEIQLPASWSSRTVILRHPISNDLFLGIPASESFGNILTLRLSIADILASNSNGIVEAIPYNSSNSVPVLMAQDIAGFVRTPNGRGLLAVGQEGEIGLWEKRQLGKMSKHSQTRPQTLVSKGHWMGPSTPSRYAIYAKGRAIVTYTKTADGSQVLLQHLDSASSTPSDPVAMPHFAPKDGDDIEMLLAVSDIDDGYTGGKRHTRRAVIMAVARSGEAWVWRADPPPASSHVSVSPNRVERQDSTISGSSPLTFDDAVASEPPIVSLLSHSRLPVEGGQRPRLILPVDPMGWHQSAVDWDTDTCLQDMVLTVSELGVLEFWTPRLGPHLAGRGRQDLHRDAACNGNESAAWTRSGLVRTGKTNVITARCSSRKKTVLVCETPDGTHEMTIWDSNVSEFSTGLELVHYFGPGEIIQDLDWTTTSDLQSVLAVGFAHNVVLVCEQRMSYVDITPGWAPFLTINMEKYTSVPINDSIWIAGGSLAIATGNQVYVFSRFIERDTPITSPSASAIGVVLDSDDPEDIFQLIAHRNGPLYDYHPTIIGQCLLWDKIDLVKRIIVALVKSLRDCERSGRRRLIYNRLDPLEFHTSKRAAMATHLTTRDYTGLFETAPNGFKGDDDEFDESLVQELVDRIDGEVSIPLLQGEKSSLATIAQATLEVDQSRRSLDICGLRYLISIRTFVNRGRRGGSLTPSGISTPVSGPSSHARISFRNIVWATHSESHEVLLQAATASCNNGKMSWNDAKHLGVFLWLKSPEAIRNQLELIARNRFMADEERDPTCASLLFFALGKKQVVLGLWRQAPGHKEQNLMLKFLSNDFETERWKTAAAKNAYALLSKQRYEYAAAFFMLAGSPKDAINVCLRQLNDWQLAVALARTVEGGSEGPILRWVITDTVLPIAFSGGHRWLASWALWTLNRRDLAVRVLISPMDDVAAAWSPDKPVVVGNPDNDDPSLLLLFQHLKARTLQTAKGTSEIPTKLEFDFVLHNARVFFRMGCHPLGLDLLRSWSFDRPFYPPPKARRSSKVTITSKTDSREASPVKLTSGAPYHRPRRPSFMLARPNARRESMVMDIDVLAENGTEPSTRIPSPILPPTIPEDDLFAGFAGFNATGPPSAPTPAPESEPELVPSAAPAPPLEEQPKKVGNLMKELRQDVQQGAMEFDMGNFF